MADPIKLLDFYTERDHDILFGRNEETKSLLNLLKTYSIVILSGESGTGKTSLIRAGLIPLINEQTGVLYHRMNSDSFKQLPEKLLSCIPGVAGAGKGFENIVSEFIKYCHEESKEYVVILDQFEELLVEYRDRSEWFPVTILTDISKAGSVRFLFSLRSDYLPLFMTWLHPTRLHFFAEQFYYLTRFSSDMAREVLRQMMSHYSINLAWDMFSQVTTRLAELDIEGTVYPPHLQIIAAYIAEHHLDYTTIGAQQNVEPGKGENLSEKDFTIDTITIEKILSGFFNKELFKGMTVNDRGIVKQVLDTLVGREGLRRKLTLNELSVKVQCSENILSSLLNQLIERRTLRRNEEDKFELIHDFLSRHFFESFSSEEKHNRRLQDMFSAAMMDYRDAGIFLDERRIRLFLHYRDILDLNKEARILLIKSVLSLFVIGFNPYLDLTMSQDLLDLLRIENNKDNRLSMISKLNGLVGYNDLPVLKEVYEKETDYMAKTDLLSIIAELDPDWVKKICEECLENWQELQESFLEGIIRSIRHFVEPYFSRLILPILSGHASDSIQFAAIETLEILKDPSILSDLLSLLEQKKITISRVIESYILAIDNLLLYVQDKSEYESFINRFIKVLKKLIYKSVYVSQPNAFSAYIKLSVPDPAECESLLITTQDNYNIESILRAMGEIGDSAYKDTLLFFIKNTNDNTYIETAVSSLGRLKGAPDYNFYRNLFTVYSSPLIRGVILDNLIESENSEAMDLFHLIIRSEDEQDSNLLIKASTGLAKFGNKADIQLLEQLLDKTKDVNMKEHYVATISEFNNTYAGTIKKVLKKVWNNEDEDSLKILTGCKLFLLGDSSYFPYLLERLSRIDEHFGKYIQQSLFTFYKDSVLEIFRALLMYQGPYPDSEATKRTLQQIVLRSANREYASIALSIIGSRFGSQPGLRDWFYELIGTANKPEIRGLAIIAIAETQDDSILDFIEEWIFTSNWPVTQNSALFGLGILDLDEQDHIHRINILINFITETPSYELLDHALWIYYACARNSDIGKLEQLLSDKTSMKISNAYYMKRIEGIIYSINEKPIEDRALPTLANLYKMENYSIRQSLRITPMFFSF